MQRSGKLHLGNAGIHAYELKHGKFPLSQIHRPKGQIEVPVHGVLRHADVKSKQIPKGAQFNRRGSLNRDPLLCCCHLIAHCTKRAPTVRQLEIALSSRDTFLKAE